jgi:hypothetical protein
MKKIINFLAFSFLTIGFVGCGGGGSSSSDDGSSSLDNSESTTAINNVDRIEPLKPYLGLARKLVTGTQKMSCFPTDDGKGKVISQVASGSTIQFSYTEYDNEQCIGDALTMELSYYSLTIGNEINEGKALEVNLQFAYGDNIVDKVPNHMLGYDIGSTFYTTMVASDDEAKGEIKMGIATPTQSYSGISSELRANDVSDYTSGKYYFSN